MVTLWLKSRGFMSKLRNRLWGDLMCYNILYIRHKVFIIIFWR